MIKLLVGQPGSGKTKDMIKNANTELKSAKGNIVYVSESKEGILELKHDIRYISLSELPLDSSSEFIGFLHGLISSNYDIESIYLDGVLNVFIMTPKEISAWLERLKPITEKHNVKFEISVSHPGDVPEVFTPYM